MAAAPICGKNYHEGTKQIRRYFRTGIPLFITLCIFMACSIQEPSAVPVKAKYRGFSNTPRPISNLPPDSTSTPQNSPANAKSSAPARFAPYDTAPEPIGGYGQIQKNVVYPAPARGSGIEGSVVVQCYILTNGQVGECKFIKGMPGYGFNEAALAAVKSVRWKPAQQLGKPVPVWISIPVVFRPASR